MNRIFSLVAALSAFGLVGLAACSGSVTEEEAAADDGTLGEDQEIIKSQGKMCGGIAGIRCVSGLNCKLKGSYPDASGTCVKPAAGELGALCGGIGRLQCKSSLVCKFTSPTTSGGMPPGAMGMPSPAKGTCEVSSGPPPGTMGMPKPSGKYSN